ncbi:ABC transporter ATP-binding protein [Pelistega sp. NLN82]|uniref:ABC transporter ATP-binding protein n=1 Tax=Pelistega ratti TaxID=2652177 RepID=A0A6L9Y668_9BURK|nr:ABC transporter ATP-binding protein [Pelistega ratti]NEN75314.1 ABC transporter ATP-binding protein [Pelistega ratti]
MQPFSLSTIINHPCFTPILLPIRQKIIISIISAAFAGVATLIAYQCLVYLVAEQSVIWLYRTMLFFILGAILGGISLWLAHNAENQFAKQLQLALINKALHIPKHTLSKYNNHSLRRLLSEDVSELHYMVAHLPAELSVLCVVPIFSAGFLFYYLGAKAIWVLLPGIMASLYYLWMVPYINQRDGVGRMQTMKNMIDALNDYTRGVSINRIFGQDKGALENYRQSSDNFLYQMNLWIKKVVLPASFAVSLLQAVATFTIAYIIAKNLDMASLLGVIFFSLAVVTPALRLGHGLDYVITGRTAASRIITFLSLPNLPYGEQLLPKVSLSFNIKNLSFSLENRKIFHQLNYEFPRGEITILTGQSGVGKSSLLSILAGQEVPNSGEVYINKVAIYELSQEEQKKHILFIPQHHAVIASSIRDNMHLFVQTATDIQLLNALQKVHLNKDLNFPTHQLSGGEKQRLILAIVLLSTAQIILLDEPMSALDRQATNELLALLENFVKQHKKILIMITHDHSLIPKFSSHLHLSSYQSEGENSHE